MSADHKIDGRTLSHFTTDDIISICPMCAAWAVVELTPALKAKQPDDTTHVCHPGFGGCNHGFAIEEASNG